MVCFRVILVTGASGQLGNAIIRRLTSTGEPFMAVTRPEFEFANPATLTSCFETAEPSLVINTAAYTAVDKAEADQDAAIAANHIGPLLLAMLCAKAGIPFIHISTDYVFDGNKGAPYLETDPTNPTGVYGATKCRGEEAILATDARATILRTAWVYSRHGKNFARTMINAGRKLPVLRVVADQRGTPTAAADLAAAILHIARKIAETGWLPRYRGVFHATSSGETTWHGFAGAIFQEAEKLGYTAPEVQPIATKDWPTAARRPPDSRLDCSKLEGVFNVTLPNWRTSLPRVIFDLIDELDSD